MEEENENFFNELEQDFSDEEELKPTKQNNEVEIKPEDITSFNYLKNPEAGESVEIEVKRIIKKPGREMKNKENGETFWTGLKDKNDKREETILETTTGDRFGITSWSLYFALFGKDSKFQKKANERGTFEGIKLRINHVYNGKDSTTKVGDLMKLRGFSTEEEAQEHKKKVGKAIKDGKIYSVEVLN